MAATTTADVAIASLVSHDALPCLYVSSVKGVTKYAVLEEHVLDIVWRIRILPNRPYRKADSFNAGHIFDKNVCAIAFDSYAIITSSRQSWLVGEF